MHSHARIWAAHALQTPKLGLSWWPSGKNSPVNAGEYKLLAKVSNQNTNYRGSAELLFTIEKAPLNIKVKDIAINIFEFGSLPKKYDCEITGLVKEEKLIKMPDFSYKNQAGILHRVRNFSPRHARSNSIRQTCS